MIAWRCNRWRRVASPALAQLQEAGYTFTGPHKKVHDIFTRRIADFQNRFTAGEDIADELHAMLSRWLLNHIRNEDQAYVATVAAHLRRTRAAQPSAADENPVLDQRTKSWRARLFNG